MRLPLLSTGINDTFLSLTLRSDLSMIFLLVQNVCVLVSHIPPLLLIHWHNLFTLSGVFGGCCGIGLIGEVPIKLMGLYGLFDFCDFVGSLRDLFDSDFGCDFCDFGPSRDFCDFDLVELECDDGLW